MLMRGDAVTVLKWIEALTPVIQDHLWLVIYQSWGYICTGQLEKIEFSLQGVENQINSSKLKVNWDAVQAHIAAIRALVFLRRGDVPHAIEMGHLALECLPPSAANIHSVIVYTLGEANWLAGDLDGAKHAFAEASLIDAATGNVLAAVLALSSVAVLMTEQGELHRAEENYQTAIQMATLSNGRLLPAAARACLGLSSLEYEWNDLPAATYHVEQALELGRRWGNPDTLAGIHLMKARLLRAKGDTQGAFELLNQADGLGSGRGLILSTMDQLNAFRVQLWLAQGNLIAASNWARGQTFIPDEPITYSMQSSLLTQVRILIAQDQSETAMRLLVRLYEQAEASGQLGRALELLLLQARVHKDLGDTPRALAVLSQALTIGQSEGYLRTFLDEGAPIVELLRLAASHGISPKYVAGLLSHFDRGAAPSRVAPQPLIEPLTERELQVLRLLAEGLSNQAIAGQLIVALGTVKTHTASVYRKLDVISRSQAVARARDLGLDLVVPASPL